MHPIPIIILLMQTSPHFGMMCPPLRHNLQETSHLQTWCFGLLLAQMCEGGVLICACPMCPGVLSQSALTDCLAVVMARSSCRVQEKMNMKNGVRIFRSLGFVFALISVVAFGAVLALGQAIDGNIVGTVTDASGAAVVGAEVTATNVATNVMATTKSGGSGEYRVDHLLVGDYRISVKMTGFKTINEMVGVELNKTGTRNISLVPGAATETVEVSGVPPTIDTTTAQITNNFDEVQTSSLATATVGSGVNNLALYNSGVASPGGLGAGSGPALSGQRSRNNNFTIEGVDNN